MKVAIIKERRPHEHRVAATPDSVKRTVEIGVQVTVESGAGAGAYFTDEAYREAGATVAGDSTTALSDADIVLKVQRPLRARGDAQGDAPDELGAIRRGAALVGLLAPLESRDDIEAYAAAG